MPPTNYPFEIRVFLNLWFAKPVVCTQISFHENSGNHENDENDQDNSDSYKQGVECWISGNHSKHGNAENHGNLACKPRVGNEKSASIFSARNIFAPPPPQESWTSARSGHGCPHPNACFSKVSRACPKLLPWDVGANGPETSTGYPARKLFLWALLSFLNGLPKQRV